MKNLIFLLTLNANYIDLVLVPHSN